MERQRRVRRALAELAEPVSRMDAEETCVERDWREFEIYPLEGLCEVNRGADGDPGLTRRIEFQENRGCAALQVLQDLEVRRLGVGVGDFTAQVPRAINVSRAEKRSTSLRRRGRRLQGLDSDVVCGGSHETLVEGLPLQDRLDKAHPLFPGVRRKA